MIYRDDFACGMRRATGGWRMRTPRRMSVAFRALNAVLRLLYSSVHLIIDAPEHQA